MAEVSGKNMVHEMARWKTRCSTELESAAAWEENWGFLKSEQIKEKEAQFAADNAKREEEERNNTKPLDRMEAKMRFRGNREKTPKEIFPKPRTSSHAYGWYPNKLEEADTSIYGIKRNTELMPER